MACCEALQLAVTTEITVNFRYALNLVVVEINLGEVYLLTKSMELFDLVVGTVEQTDFLHLGEIFALGELLKVVVAHVNSLNFLAAVTLDKAYPVFEQFLARYTSHAGDVEHLQFGQFRKHIHGKRGHLGTVVNLHICERGEVLPAPRILLIGIFVTGINVVYKEVLACNGRVCNIELVKLGTTHYGL